MQNSSIEWTDHTFNPWHGCFKVSDGCKHCYAETLSKRFGRDIWGPPATTPRRMMSENYWRQPIKWNAAAQAAGTRARVFCASMADVFEDHPQVNDARLRLFTLIDETPHLDWLLLTKRPENIRQFWVGEYRPNVWRMTSVENQEQAERRIPLLLATGDLSPIAGLSCEPLLGAMDISRLLVSKPCFYCGNLDGEAGRCFCGMQTPSEIQWVIVGGESGHGARPMSISWVRALQSQCQEADVSFFFKQWGEHTPYYEAVDPVAGKLFMAEYPKGTMKRVGKHVAGRLLDGRTWDELPI